MQVERQRRTIHCRPNAYAKMRLALWGFVLGAALCTPLDAKAQEPIVDSLRARWDSVGLLMSQGTRAGRLEARRLLERALVQSERAGRPHITGLFLAVLGRTYRIDGPPDSAVIVLERAIPLLRDSASISRAHAELGDILTAQGRHPDAAPHFDEALRLLPVHDRRVAYDIRTQVGKALVETRAFQRSQELYELAYEDAVALNEPALIGYVILHFGVLRENEGNADSARALYRRAARENGGDALLVAQAEMAEAESWIFANRPVLALPLYERASPVLERLGAGVLSGRTREHIGIMYSQLGRYQEALRHFRSAESEYRDAGQVASANGMLVLMGNALTNMDSLDAARQVYDAADSAMSRLQDTVGLARLYVSRGVLMTRAQPDSAAAWFERALRYSRSPGAERIRATALNNLGNELVWANPDSALSLYFTALGLERALSRRGESAIILRNIAHAYHRVVRPQRLDLAVAYYDSAAAEVARVGEWAGSDLNRLAFTETRAALYGYWARAWAARASEPEVGPGRATTAALGAADRGRATILADLLGVAGPDTLPGADLAERTDSLLRSLSLRAEESAIYYLTTPDTLMVWLVLPNGEVVLSVQAVSETWLRARIDSLRTALGVAGGCVIQQSPSDYPAALLDELSAVLLPTEIRSRLFHGGGLLLFPHGPLNRLPFAALRSEQAGEPLGLRYALRYSPSLAISAELASASSSPKPTPFGQALVVGNPTMPRVALCGIEYTPGELPAAGRSSRAVAAQLGVDPLTGDTATEAAVRTRLPEASVVYFATHGFAYESPEGARNSFVALAPVTGNTSENDGKLTVAEILDELPPLQAELVALATCRSGLGQLHEGEGTVGLQRALLARGARSVLVSLWDVDDRASEVLLNEFFVRWLQGGLSKAEALREAQAVVASNPLWAHPRFWAAYQLAGAN